MTTLSLTIDGQVYSAEMSDAQHVKIEGYRLAEMAVLPPGEGQTAETPASERPRYCADVPAFVKMMIVRSEEPANRRQAVLDRILANADDAPAPTPEELAPLTGEALKASLRAYAAQKRYAVETGGCIDANGHAIGTDRDSQTKLIAEMVAISAGMRTDPSPWKLRGNGFVMLTNAQMIQVITAARNHIANSFVGEAIALAGIEAETITTPAQVDAVAWPSNN